ncbi:hypothetical protein N0824_03531 [Microcystis sp. 0824]|nr:hypothetical protein N0824_03531 [Microcystis sp. 0824]
MVNLDYNKNRLLPSAEELPCSDETPVDNQLHQRHFQSIWNFLVNLLGVSGLIENLGLKPRRFRLALLLNMSIVYEIYAKM